LWLGEKHLSLARCMYVYLYALKGKFIHIDYDIYKTR
jgi:hypothetical protein